MNIQGIICQPDDEGGTIITIHTHGHITEPEVRERLGTETKTAPILSMSAGQDAYRTIAQAAKELHISEKSIRRAIEKKELKYILPPMNSQRYRLVNLRDIRRLMKVSS